MPRAKRRRRRAPPPAPAPDVFLGAEGWTLQAVARRGSRAGSENGFCEESVRSAAADVTGVALQAGSGSVADDARRGDFYNAGDDRAGCGRGCWVVRIARGFRADRLPGSDWGAEAAGGGAGERRKSAGGEDACGVPEGSNPLFDDSDEET